VALDRYIPLADLSRHFKVDPDMLQRMNLALRQPVFSGQKHVPKGFVLRLPAHVEDTLLASIPDPLYHNAQMPSRFYTVQKGDTASKIARQNGVPLNDLIAANKLDRKGTIYPKQTLRIPGAGEQIPTSTMLASAKTEPVQTIAVSAPAQKAVEKVITEQVVPPSYPAPVLASIIPLPAVDSAPALQDQADTAEKEPSEQIVSADIRFEKIYEYKGRRIGILQVEVEENLGRYAEWAGVRVK
jgi:membrane-bound lytic murein transglycosylase D